MLNSGHRKRLRARFLKTNLRTLPDYELLEIMLFYAIPRADTKALAKRLLAEFGSLAGVINADEAALKSIEGAGEGVKCLFKVLLDFSSRLLLPTESVHSLNVLDNWHSVLDYCKITMGYQKKSESFRVLYLNRKNHLIADEFQDYGTIDRVHVYPREIARKVIESGASAVILVHNHPSGDTKPSNDDLVVTRNIAKALEPLGALVHDHLIVAGREHFSFRANRLV